MAYFNSRTLGFYPGVDEADKEDANIPDEEVLDPYEWDNYDDDPYEDIRPHLVSSSPMTGEPVQALHHISVPPVVTSKLAGEKTEMGEPSDMCQEPEVMKEDHNMESHQPIQNPEMEVIEAQVKVMEEKSKKVQKEVDMQPTISTCGTQFNMSLEEKMDGDSRSVYIGNVDCSVTAEVESEGNLVKSIQEKMEQPLIDPEQPLPVELYDINQCQVLSTFDLGSLQLEPFAGMSEKPLEEDPKKAAKEVPNKVAKEDPKKDSKKAANNDLKKDSKNTSNEDPAQMDPKKDSKKADVVPINDARPEESIIDCVNLLDDFEASFSDSNSSDLKNQVNQLVTNETKLFDLITLCGHPLTIYHDDLRSLQGRSYVTEGALEFFLDVMFQEIDVRTRKDIHILSTAIFATLKGRFEKGDERSLQLTENIFDKNYIIIPICNNSHWIIAVATRFNH